MYWRRPLYCSSPRCWTRFILLTKSSADAALPSSASSPSTSPYHHANMSGDLNVLVQYAQGLAHSAVGDWFGNQVSTTTARRACMASPGSLTSSRCGVHAGPLRLHEVRQDHQAHAHSHSGWQVRTAGMPHACAPFIAGGVHACAMRTLHATLHRPRAWVGICLMIPAWRRPAVAQQPRVERDAALLAELQRPRAGRHGQGRGACARAGARTGAPGLSRQDSSLVGCGAGVPSMQQGVVGISAACVPLVAVSNVLLYLPSWRYAVRAEGRHHRHRHRAARGRAGAAATSRPSTSPTRSFQEASKKLRQQEA